MNSLEKLLLEQRKKTMESRGIKLKNTSVRPAPKTLALQYSKHLSKMQIEINEGIREQLNKLLFLIENLRIDSINDDVTTTFLAIKKAVDEFLDQGIVSNGISLQGERLFEFNQRKYDKEIFKILAINDLDATVTSTLLDGWVTENLELIKGVNDEQVKKLESLFLRSARDGSRAADIEAEVSKALKISVNRAKLIARDQTFKLNGQIDRIKQTRAGIKKYIWRTAKDEAVRSQHAEREGEVFKWADPPPGGNPGQAVNCRCTAEPYLEDLLRS